MLVMTLARNGSVTVVKTIGISLVAAATAWLTGVVMATMTSGCSPTT